MEELYKQNVRIVYHFLFSLCHDSGLAEELTQETFFQAYRSLERYDGSCKISSWLCQIAKHLFYQHIRKTKREIPLEMEHEEQSEQKDTTEHLVMSRIELLDVLKEMQKLPQNMREVMYLRITGDLSFRDIGDIMGKSENWARVNFYRGKELLLKRRMRDE